MSVLFSSDDLNVINRTLDPHVFSNSPIQKPSELEDVYELSRCISWIQEKSFTKVALQFPDSQLVDSVAISLMLEKSTNAEIFILGDVTYGSCCVDSVSAEHAGADCLIHFGPSCLSPLSKNSLPVLYVFVQKELECQHIQELVQASEALSSSKCLLLLYEVTYAKSAHKLRDLLSSIHPCVVVSELKLPDSDEVIAEAKVCCQRIFPLPANHSLGDCSILYLGEENLTQSNLIMNFRECPFYTYDPVSRLLAKAGADINRTLKRRFYIVEKLKDADIIGILVGTLGVVNYLPVVEHLKNLVKQRGKRCYVLAVGKPNVAKLANFPEIEVFVLVACSENALLDSKEFLAPIATPFELELALNPARNFEGGQYVTDFSQLLPGGQSHIPLGTYDEKEEGDVSLVTGKLRTFNLKQKEETQSEAGSSVVIRNGMALATLHARAAGEHLSQRTWQGLEQQLGMTPAALVKEGQSGIASAYVGEG